MSVSKRSFQLLAWFSAFIFLLASIACNNEVVRLRLGESAWCGRDFPESALSKVVE